jgi:hypothetical protein
MLPYEHTEQLGMHMPEAIEKFEIWYSEDELGYNLVLFDIPYQRYRFCICDRIKKHEFQSPSDEAWTIYQDFIRSDVFANN